MRIKPSPCVRTAQPLLVPDLHLWLWISTRIELTMNSDALPMNDGMDFDERRRYERDNPTIIHIDILPKREVS